MHNVDETEVVSCIHDCQLVDDIPAEPRQQRILGLETGCSIEEISFGRTI